MNKTAKLAVFTGVNEPFEIREYPLTVPAGGMAQLELLASGVCGTDLHIHHGKIPVGTPMVIGHEFVGKVVDISAEDSKASGIAAGDNAIVDIACPCGECLLCANGDDANCIHMTATNSGSPEVAPHFHGGYGEFGYSPVKNLIKIPENLDPTMVCVYACAGPTAIHAFQLAQRANCSIEKANVAVVQGLGPVGTFAAMYMAALGIPHVIAVTAFRDSGREELAKKLGVTDIFSLADMTIDEIIGKVREMNGGMGADVVFEASGNPKAVPQGMDMLRNRGVYLVPGQYSNSGKVEIAPQMITFNALHIIGSSQYAVADVQTYLDFLQMNPALHETIRSLATAYRVEDVNQAFADAKAGKNVKTILSK